MKFGCIERPLSRFFYRYGMFIADHPFWFLFAPLIVTAGLAPGFYFFKGDTDIESLYAPDNSQAEKERQIVQSLFDESTSEWYDLLRANFFWPHGRVIMTTTADDGNMLSPKNRAKVLQLDKLIRNVTVTYDGSSYNYEDLCARWEGKCLPNAVLILPPSDDIHYPIHTHGVYRISMVSALGGITLSDTGVVKSAAAWQLYYALDNHELSFMWQTRFLELLESPSLPGIDTIQIQRFTADTVEEELSKNTGKAIPLFTITFSLLITFGVITCMSTDAVVSKQDLGNLGVVSAGLATASSFGLLLYIGLPFIDVVAICPFLVIGIGMDDMFVMLASWRHTDIRLPVRERMASAFADAAMSITITSITDVLAIGIGAISPFRSVRIFCIYTGVAIAFDYLYQITFFASCMVLTGRREAAHRHAATCHKVLPRSEAGNRSLLYRLFCTGGHSEKNPNAPEDSGEIWAMKFFRDYWGTFLSWAPVKVIIVHVYFVYLGFAIWGCTKVELGLKMSNLASDNSYARAFYDVEDRYFMQYGPAVMVVVKAEMQFWKSSDRDRVEKLLQRFENDTENYHGIEMTLSWTRELVRYCNETELTADNFQSKLTEFLSLSQFKQFGLDIKLKADNRTTYATRFLVFSKDTTSTNRQWAIMDRSREIIGEKEFESLDVNVHNMFFVFWEQYARILPNTLQNLGIATVAMMVVSLLLIPHPVCAVYVTFSIVSISTGLIGYMAIWKVNLDMITMVNIIMCIGFCVDFSAHIAYAFMISPGTNRNKRMRKALYALGFPIAQGAVSTLLGIISLSISDVYIFRAFAKTMFLVIFLGAIHGLVILPVILSVTGPASIIDDSGEIRHSSAAGVSPIHAISAGVDQQRSTDYAGMTTVALNAYAGNGHVIMGAGKGRHKSQHNGHVPMRENGHARKDRKMKSPAHRAARVGPWIMPPASPSDSALHNTQPPPWARFHAQYYQ